MKFLKIKLSNIFKNEWLCHSLGLLHWMKKIKLIGYSVQGITDFNYFILMQIDNADKIDKVVSAFMLRHKSKTQINFLSIAPYYFMRPKQERMSTEDFDRAQFVNSQNIQLGPRSTSSCVLWINLVMELTLLSFFGVLISKNEKNKMTNLL